MFFSKRAYNVPVQRGALRALLVLRGVCIKTPKAIGKGGVWEKHDESDLNLTETCRVQMHWGREKRHISENGFIIEGAALHRYHFALYLRFLYTIMCVLVHVGFSETTCYPIVTYFRRRWHFYLHYFSAVLKGDLIANLSSKEGCHSAKKWAKKIIRRKAELFSFNLLHSENFQFAKRQSEFIFPLKDLCLIAYFVLLYIT